MEEIKKQILEYLQSIPKGKVTTYKNIALKFWVHPRKVMIERFHDTQQRNEFLKKFLN